MLKRPALMLSLLLAACAVTPLSPDLAGAVGRMPPMIIGFNTTRADGAGPYPLSCPAPGARLEQRGQPPTDYLGTNPSNPDLCRMRIAGQTMDAWYGIWVTTWPGAADAYPAMRRVIQGRSGETAAFDTVAAPGVAWHEVLRNEGIEDIELLGRTYHAMKLSHYREGYGSDIYRSVATVWKDIPTGLIIYGTYQHISGAPELDGPILPTAIVPGR